MRIEIPRGYPVYAFVPEWVVYVYWLIGFVLFISIYQGWNKWLTLSYRS